MSEKLLNEVLGELRAFKSEFREFKSEMLDFKTEMLDFKFEMQDFKLDTEIRLERTESKIDRLERKLDATFEQVVRNTEHDSKWNEIAVSVEEQQTDIKILKKLAAGG
ncbi:hypothetical protein ACFPVX_05935 [Cohnella faecalis]|uniref:Uncharacterized protein n=1 Tax=Cohnella faecalis TaxID=2315694 RepID=A0A398CID0_9BACL|nr:hypothetical protein [Cohnella faecalis]RIE02125.1 hypothetical protein D3H35_15310 [Cohnella faecalis]